LLENSINTENSIYKLHKLHKNIDMRFGEYLVTKNLAQNSDVARALMLQKQEQVSLSQLCFENGILTNCQIQECLDLQAAEHRTFADIALQLGFLNAEELEELSREQRHRTPFLGQLLVRLGVLSAESMYSALQTYSEVVGQEKEQLKLELLSDNVRETKTFMRPLLSLEQLDTIQADLGRSISNLEYYVSGFHPDTDFPAVAKRIAFFANQVRGSALVNKLPWLPDVAGLVEQGAMALMENPKEGAAVLIAAILRATGCMKSFASSITHTPTGDDEILEELRLALEKVSWGNEDEVLQKDVDALISSISDEKRNYDKNQPLAGYRCLVVDDVRTIRNTVASYLASFGATSDVSEHGATAFKMLAQNSDYDLVIVDLDMPVMDGVELVSLMRRLPSMSNIPVLMLSGHMRMKTVRRAVDAGINGYVLKSNWKKPLLEKAKNLLSVPKAA